MTHGSSPLTRGKPHRGVPDRAGTGLIPAHAGKTTTPGVATCPCRAHPRSRGENHASNAHLRAFEGSSPLTRGKRERCHSLPSCSGLIPAHAGKTSAVTDTKWCDKAHPRSRGENPSNPSANDLTPGSSPLTRGKPKRSAVP